MFDVKVGKLMVNHVIRNNNQKGGLYEFVRVEDYSDNTLSILGKDLIELTHLFIEFMNVEEEKLNYNTKQFKDVFCMVDIHTKRNPVYCYLEKTSQYIRITDEDKLAIGKWCWEVLSKTDYCFNITDIVTISSEDFYMSITDNLENIKMAKRDFHLHKSQEISTISHKVFLDIQQAIYNAAILTQERKLS